MSGSYTYDWSTNPPTTTDPKYVDNFICGRHQDVLRNGSVVQHVRRCCMGPKGWVDVTPQPIQIDGDDELVEKRIHGDVRYVCHR